MTHYMPADTRAIHRKLDELHSALIRLDQYAVEAGCEDLAGLFVKLRESKGRVSPSEAAALRVGMVRVQGLIDNAGHLYAGWARIAAFDGPAYTQEGTEAAAPSKSSMAVEG